MPVNLSAKLDENDVVPVPREERGWVDARVEEVIPEQHTVLAVPVCYVDVAFFRGVAREAPRVLPLRPQDVDLRVERR